MSEKNHKPTPREVPTNYREILNLESVKSLSWRDRFKILLGYNLKFKAVIYTQHRVGHTRQATGLELTTQLADPPPKDNVFMV